MWHSCPISISSLLQEHLFQLFRITLKKFKIGKVWPAQLKNMAGSDWSVFTEGGKDSLTPSSLPKGAKQGNLSWQAKYCGGKASNSFIQLFSFFTQQIHVQKCSSAQIGNKCKMLSSQKLFQIAQYYGIPMIYQSGGEII